MTLDNTLSMEELGDMTNSPVMMEAKNFNGVNGDVRIVTKKRK